MSLSFEEFQPSCHDAFYRQPFQPKSTPFHFLLCYLTRQPIMTVKRKGTSLRNELSAHLRACHPREGGASQPHLDDFAAMSSSENVRYLKKSFATIKRHLKPFKALEKGYSRNLHGFFDHIKTFVQRLDDVIVFLDSENKVPTHQDVINFLQQRRDVAAALDVTSDQLHGRGRCAPSAPRREEVRSTTGKSNAKRKRT